MILSCPIPLCSWCGHHLSPLPQPLHLSLASNTSENTLPTSLPLTPWCLPGCSPPWHFILSQSMVGLFFFSLPSYKTLCSVPGGNIIWDNLYGAILFILTKFANAHISDPEILLTGSYTCEEFRANSKKAMATHSGTLAWKIPWTEESGRLQSMGSHKVRHDWSDLACMHALEKEMATHSSSLTWRIPGMVEPGGLPSMGSPRVGHDWSDLTAGCFHTLIIVNNVTVNTGVHMSF